ncbi:MAG TPA: hypothetical protein VK705_03240 [Ferruginibacter sp.]|nr:hypothetical protein [Ferruginibacter sp.]
MKQIAITAAILFSAFAGYAQQMNFSNNYNKEEYNQLRIQSKHERIAAIILVSGGAGLIAGGLITAFIGGTENITTDEYGNEVNHTDDNLIRTGLIIAGAGVAAELISIPFFVKSHSDRNQAREIRLHANSSSYTVPLSGSRSVNQPQLGISCSISL